MSQIAAAANSPTADQPFGSASALNDLDLNSFLELMIAELQNQDPLNPLDNAQLLQQISQIREVGATEQLTQTLGSVLLGQNIASATNLIGAQVTALTDDGERVSGPVRRVTIDGGQPRIDLAVGPLAAAGTEEGDIEEGAYVYQVVWNGTDGQEFSFDVATNTANLSDFNGTIQLRNLPETDGEKRIYRTDATGEGDRQLVATLPNGTTTSFIDSVANSRRQATLTTTPQQLGVARRVTVNLSNIAQIEPPPN